MDRPNDCRLFTVLIGIAFSQSSQCQSVATPTAIPAAIRAGASVVVTVRTRVHASLGQNIVRNGVNLLQVDQNGNNPRVLATMNDDGANGDLIAQDGDYGASVALSQASIGRMYIQVSAASYGTLKRTLSPVGSILVAPASLPVSPYPTSTTNAVASPDTGKPVVCNELLVGFQPGISPVQAAAAITSAGGGIAGMLPAMEVYQVTAPGCDAGLLKSLKSVLMTSPIVSFADYDSIGRIASAVTSSPNDPYYLQTYPFPNAIDLPQWYLKQINTTEAWSVAQSRGLKGGVPIGFVDSGINSSHEDLFGRVLSGLNWCGSISGGACSNTSISTEDDEGHGTFVAGLAAALSNNGLGIASPAFDTVVVAEKVNSPAGDRTGVTTSAVANGIADAVSLGLAVVNVSATVEGSGALERAVSFANDRGVIIVAAAGNDGEDLPEYPASLALKYPNVIAVGATDQHDNRATFTRSDGFLCNTSDMASNFGSWVTLYAPGSEIFGLLFTNNTGQSAYGYRGSEPRCSAGTSFAAPLVA